MSASLGFPVNTFEGALFSTNIRKEIVLAYIRKYRPTTVEDLRERLAHEGFEASNDALLGIIGQLRSEGVSLGRHGPGGSFSSFLGDVDLSWWVYVAVIVSVTETLLVFYQQETGILAVLRLLFGLAVLGFLPGYATTQTFLPGDQITQLERVLLSIFLSVVISIAIGVALGAGYFFNATLSVLSSTGYTVALSLTGAYREYSWLRKIPAENTLP